jgi:hypothetical protein
MSYSRPIKFSATNLYGNTKNGEDDVYTVEEFKERTRSGMFIDYDGHGYPVKNSTANTGIIIRPSKINDIPEDATHIVWFNR